MTINPWPIKGRPRFRIDEGEYIAQIIGCVEHLSYGSENNAPTQAMKWYRAFGWLTPQWHYRYIIQPLGLIDADTGEIKDVSDLLPQLSRPYAITQSNLGLMTVLQQTFGLKDTDDQLYYEMVGKVIKVPVIDKSHANYWDLRNCYPTVPSDPTKLTDKFIYWGQSDDEPLIDVMPTSKLAYSIQASIDRAELTRLNLLKEINK